MPLLSASQWIKVLATATLITTSLGCTLTADKAEVEKVVKDGLKAKGLELKTVSCPDKLAPKKGESFDCTATDDEDVAGKIKITWGEGTKFDMDAVTALGLEKAGTQMNDVLGQQVNSKVTIQCPSKFIFIKEGRKWTCDATVESAPGVAHKVDFTLKDDQGNMNAKLRPASEAPAP